MAIYHILNRGVDKRKIFMNDKDRFRFMHDLFEFNDIEPITNNNYLLKNNSFIDIERRYIDKTLKRKPRKLLVEIYAFCLMDNHYHLLVKPLLKDSLPLFMKKLNMGYSKYFNKKYERSGTLFEGRYKSIILTDHAHFLHIPYYIHMNPLDLIMPGWRSGEIEDSEKALEFLKNYRWSSFLDYVGQKNFPSVTQREFLLDFFGGEKEYEKETKRWLKERSNNMEDIGKLILE